MGPCVRSDLMAFGYHASEERGVRVCGINGAFAVAVAGDEEGCCEIESAEGVKEGSGVWGGAVVVG